MIIQANKTASKRTIKIILENGPSFEIADARNSAFYEGTILLLKSNGNGSEHWVPSIELTIVP